MMIISDCEHLADCCGIRGIKYFGDMMVLENNQNLEYTGFKQSIFLPVITSRTQLSEDKNKSKVFLDIF